MPSGDAMNDLKKAANELGAKAAFAAAREKAGRAIEDVLSTEEERDKRKAERAAAAKRKRTKWLVLGVIGLLLLIGVVGMALRYWPYFLLLGIVALAALYGRHRWRKSRSSAKQVEVARVEERPIEVAQRAPPPALAKPEVDAAIDDASIDEELAALKARVKKQG